MNIFILDEDPEKAAKYHCDVHTKSQILEGVQMLCTAHWLSLFLEDENSYFKNRNELKNYLEEKYPVGHPKRPTYKMTHINHPCTKWVAKRKINYMWLVSLLRNLGKEFEFRNNKIHMSTLHLDWLEKNIPSSCKEQIEKISFYNCVPEDYLIEGNVVESYRNFYRNGKQRVAKWERGREKPSWL